MEEGMPTVCGRGEEAVTGDALPCVGLRWLLEPQQLLLKGLRVWGPFWPPYMKEALQGDAESWLGKKMEKKPIYFKGSTLMTPFSV